jgi:hypothetical protein
MCLYTVKEAGKCRVRQLDNILINLAAANQNSKWHKHSKNIAHVQKGRITIAPPSCFLDLVKYVLKGTQEWEFFWLRF